MEFGGSFDDSLLVVGDEDGDGHVGGGLGVSVLSSASQTVCEAGLARKVAVLTRVVDGDRLSGYPCSASGERHSTVRIWSCGPASCSEARTDDDAHD